MPIREITRRTELSCNTVRKYLASGELEPRYRRPKSPSKLDDYEQTLTSWLHRETKRPRNLRRTTKHLHQSSMQMLGHNWIQSNKQGSNGVIRTNYYSSKQSAHNPGVR